MCLTSATHSHRYCRCASQVLQVCLDHEYCTVTSQVLQIFHTFKLLIQFNKNIMNKITRTSSLSCEMIHSYSDLFPCNGDTVSMVVMVKFSENQYNSSITGFHNGNYIMVAIVKFTSNASVLPMI